MGGTGGCAKCQHHRLDGRQHANGAAILRMPEGRENGARTLFTIPTLPGPSPQGGAGLLQHGDLRVELGDALIGKGARACAVVSRIECKQFPDLLEREARGLTRPNEAQPPYVSVVISPDPTSLTDTA